MGKLLQMKVIILKWQIYMVNAAKSQDENFANKAIERAKENYLHKSRLPENEV